MALPTYAGEWTQHEAVNAMLIAATLPPISTTINIEQDMSALSAWQLLMSETRDFMAQGWQFNTLIDQKMTPSPTPGNIPVPATWLSVQIAGGRYAVRGGKLFDLVKNTTIFSNYVTASKVTLLYKWDDLPHLAKSYLVARASRKYALPRVSSELASQLGEQDELAAKVAFEREDNLLGDPNLTHQQGHFAQFFKHKRGGR